VVTEVTEDMVVVTEVTEDMVVVTEVTVVTGDIEDIVVDIMGVEGGITTIGPIITITHTVTLRITIVKTYLTPSIEIVLQMGNPRHFAPITCNQTFNGVKND